MAAPPNASGELTVAGRPIGYLREGELDGRPLVLLAHGAGAGYQSPFMAAVAAGLLARGLAVVRFHFPYMERQQRTGRRGPPDPQPVLLACWRAVLDTAATWPGCSKLVMAGKSLGGRMASMVLAAAAPERVLGAVYLGYPLHPAGQPMKLRDAHLDRVSVPQLFISGDRDPLCRLDLLRGVLARLGERARLWLVAGGDHSLATSRRQPLADFDPWLDAFTAFATQDIPPG